MAIGDFQAPIFEAPVKLRTGHDPHVSLKIVIEKYILFRRWSGRGEKGRGQSVSFTGRMMRVADFGKANLELLSSDISILY